MSYNRCSYTNRAKINRDGGIRKEIKIGSKLDQNLKDIVRIYEVADESYAGNVEEELNNKIFKVLAEREYYTEVEDWRNEVKNDVAEVIGCNADDIQVD